MAHGSTGCSGVRAALAVHVGSATIAANTHNAGNDTPMKRLLIALLTITLPLCSALAAWPEKPIRLLVGVAPGGPADLSARMIAERMSETLKQPVIVENRPGSNNLIAIMAVLASPADGYTVMHGTTGAMTISPATTKNLKYDPLRDFAPVGGVVSYSYLLVTRLGLPVTTLKDFVAYAKANPGRLSYTSPGISSVNHMGMENFSMLTGITMNHIAYKGDSEALADVLAGHVDCGFISFSLTAPQAKNGKLRALAISQPERSDIVPDVPTVREAGVPGFDLLPWTGLMVPAATPKAVVNTMNAAINDGLRHPAMVKRMKELNYNPLITTPESFRQMILDEQARWREVNTRVKLVLE